MRCDALWCNDVAVTFNRLCVAQSLIRDSVSNGFRFSCRWRCKHTEKERERDRRADAKSSTEPSFGCHQTTSNWTLHLHTLISQQTRASCTCSCTCTCTQGTMTGGTLIPRLPLLLLPAHIRLVNMKLRAINLPTHRLLLTFYQVHLHCVKITLVLVLVTRT